MITEAMLDGFKTFKAHKWVILAMWLPTFILMIGIVPLLLFIYFEISPVSNTCNFMIEIALLFLIPSVVVTLIGTSLQMGFFKSMKDDKFIFKNAFIGFKGKTLKTTSKILLLFYVFSVIIFSITYFAFFITYVLFFCFAFVIPDDSTINSDNYMMIMEFTTNSIIVIGIIVAFYFHVIFNFVIVTAYYNAKITGNKILKIFSKYFKIMKKHHFQLFRLVCLEVLIEIITIIISFLLVLLTNHVTGLTNITDFQTFVISLIFNFFLIPWFMLNKIKFLEIIEQK